MEDREEKARPVKQGEEGLAEDILKEPDQVPDDVPNFDRHGKRLEPKKK